MGGRVMERDRTAIDIASGAYSAPDMVVRASPGEMGEMEGLGAHGIEGLGLAAGPMQKRLTPAILPAPFAGLNSFWRS